MHLQDKALNQAVEQFQAAYDNLMAQVRRVTEGPVDPVTPANLTTPDKIEERGVPAISAPAYVGGRDWLHTDLQADAHRLQAEQVNQEEIEKRLRNNANGDWVDVDCDYLICLANPVRGDECDTIEFYLRHNGFMQLAYGVALAASREARKVIGTHPQYGAMAGRLKRGDANPFIGFRDSVMAVLHEHPDVVKMQEQLPSAYGLFIDGNNSHLTWVDNTPPAVNALITSLEDKATRTGGTRWFLIDKPAVVDAMVDRMGQVRFKGAVPCAVKRDHLAHYLSLTLEEALRIEKDIAA